MVFAKKFLFSSVALAFSTVVAIADGNESHLDQSGDDNAALITQSGEGNIAGHGREAHLQSGDFNALIVLQSGDDNDIGRNGIEQINRLDASPNANSAEIIQGSDDNIVGRVRQVTGAVGANRRGNDLYIEQSGGDGNRLNRAVQRRTDGGAGNRARFVQTGRDNVFRAIVQLNDLPGRANTIRARFSGNENGREPGGPAASALGDFSGLPLGVEVNVLRQLGAGNDMTLDISGNRNLLGVYQDGRGNSVGTVDVSGNANQIGLSQIGLGNLIAIDPVTGNRNDVGIQQLGVSNEATVRMTGNRNSFGILQAQADNSIQLTIDGNNNGEGRPGDTTLANAGAVIGLGAGLGFGRGLSVQLGRDNLIEHEITGNRNVFAFAQVGGANEIRGSQTGTINMAAIIQQGAANVTVFNQVGNSNDLGVTQ